MTVAVARAKMSGRDMKGAPRMVTAEQEVETAVYSWDIATGEH